MFEDLFFEILVRRDEKGENQLLCKENVLFLHCKQRIKHCNMSTTTLQIRIDEGLKEQAVSLFERLGLDLPTAIRIFLKKSVSEDGIPFDVRESHALPHWAWRRCSPLMPKHLKRAKSR